MRHSKLTFVVIGIFLLFIGFAFVFALVAQSKPAFLFNNSVISQSHLQGKGSIRFVPLGSYPSAELKKLALHYKQKLGLDIQVTPSVAIPTGAYNENRKQYISEELTLAIAQTLPEQANGKKITYIGFINEDIYIRELDWESTWSWRDTERTVAVVSPVRLHDSSSTARTEDRLRKMVTKNIGILFYKLSLSNNPRNVLYRDVGGLEELDVMTEDFLAD